MRALLFALLLSGALLAGCADTNDVVPDGNAVDGLFAGSALYDDPQNAPHPAFNWPTLSHPAVGAKVPAYWLPINGTPLPSDITGLEHLVQVEGVPAGAGIALFGRLAVVPGFGANTSIVDISDPAKPVVLSNFESQLGGHRGATIIAYPNGRLVTVISTGAGLDVWDITHPAEPQPLPPIEVGSHKVGVIPGTPIIMNAASDGGSSNGLAGEGQAAQTASGVTEMFDLSDPTNAVRLPDFENGYSCHHIYFWNSVADDKYRAICAGIEYTQIIDTSDPYNPQVLVNVPVHHGVADSPSGSIPAAAFSHYAGLSRDGTTLLVGDEHGGGQGPIGCGASVTTPLGTVSSPVGALWFYDVSDETNPLLLGYVSASQLDKADNPGPSCTAHHGRIVPAEGRDLVAMSFYGAGVYLVDFTDIGPGTLPTVVDTWADQSDTWETWYYNGYLFTGDLNRGMDVLALS